MRGGRDETLSKIISNHQFHFIIYTNFTLIKSYSFFSLLKSSVHEMLETIKSESLNGESKLKSFLFHRIGTQ